MSPESGASNEGEVRRVDAGLLHRVQRRIVRWMLPLIPSWVFPNHITVAALMLALLAALSLALSRWNHLWFGPAMLALLIHPIADALDGEVARARNRKSERGFFLDLFLDNVAFAIIYLGLAASGFAKPMLAMIGAIIHLLSDGVSTLRILLRREHVIPGFSPAEISVAAAAIAGATWIHPQPVANLAGVGVTLFDIGFFLGGTLGGWELLTSARSLYRELDGPEG